jgi:hypothetical protein
VTGTTGLTGAPHFMQNLSVSLSLLPHFSQNIPISPCSLDLILLYKKVSGKSMCALTKEITYQLAILPKF